MISKTRRFYFIFLCAFFSSALGRRRGRIIGGDIINIDQAPFNIALEYLNQQICGGAILNERWTLTASHCFGKVFLKSQALVRVGSGLRGRGGSEHSVQEIIKHPNFVLRINDCDIALMKVYPPLTYSSTVQPINLPDYHSIPNVGDTMTVYGWGYTKESGDPSDYIRAVGLPVYPHGECAAVYRNVLNVTSQMICAGERKGGRDACVLDSGGPMVWKGSLHGLVSWGFGCARVMHPGVFANTAMPIMKEWVLSIINTS